MCLTAVLKFAVTVFLAYIFRHLAEMTNFFRSFKNISVYHRKKKRIRSALNLTFH